jgi:general secretion pathway protein D
VLALTGSAVAQGDRGISLNLRDVDIRTFIEMVADVTGKRFLVDPKVTGKVTVFSGSPMTRDSLYATFLSVLQVHGFSAVEQGDAIKVTLDQFARQSSGPVAPRVPPPVSTDRFVTKVIPLREVEADKAAAVLRPLVPQNSHLAAHGDSNSLVVSDREANISRLEQIVARIDQAPGEGIEVIRLEHATAADLVSVIGELKSPAGQAGGGAQSNITADERSNSILLGGGPGERLKLRSLIAHLDIPLENTGDTHVIFLKYADAEDLASLLQARYKAVERSAKGGATPVDIQAHAFNNALLVSAPPEEYKSIQAVVRQLDIRRAQVLVEAVIAEVSSDLTSELGVQLALGDPDADSTTPALITNLGSTTLSSIIQSVIGGGAVALPNGISAGVGRVGVSGTQWAVLLTALAGDASTNILSTPVILATDNEEAEIVVGQNVPFVTGQYTGTLDGGALGVTNPFQTIERRDVGITLKIRPQINEGSSIRLEIDQEVSSIAATAVSTSDIVTNKRAISTTITVEDGQIVVLGGLIEDRNQDSTQKVPVLGDVPLLGTLFRYDRNTQVKQNLMVFLRPLILLDSELVSRYSSQKYSHLRARQQQAVLDATRPNEQPRGVFPSTVEGLFERSDDAPPVELPAAPAAAPEWSPFPYEW